MKAASCLSLFLFCSYVGNHKEVTLELYYSHSYNNQRAGQERSSSNQVGKMRLPCNSCYLYINCLASCHSIGTCFATVLYIRIHLLVGKATFFPARNPGSS